MHDISLEHGITRSRKIISYSSTGLRGTVRMCLGRAMLDLIRKAGLTTHHKRLDLAKVEGG